MPSVKWNSSSACRVGRPRLPEERKKARLSVTLSKSTLAFVDSSRGKTPRSTFIESLLENKADHLHLPREDVRRNGLVYTPSTLADYVAQKVLSYALAPGGIASHDPQNLRILDPACGRGELLLATWGHLTSRSGWKRTKGKPSPVDPRAILCGVDLDRDAASTANTRIQTLAQEQGWSSERISKILSTNGLFPFDCQTSAAGWERAKHHFTATQGFDIVIANPPWGADVSDYRTKLSSGGFTLFQGQFDSSDLFIELSLSLLAPSGFLAFIVPDSLFSQERQRLRKLLLDRTRIRFIARLGEKLFESINRACAIIICQNAPPQDATAIDCLRLTPDARKEILSGKSSFSRYDRQLTQRVSQSRFLSNPGYTFDIDVSAQDEDILRQLTASGGQFGNYLVGARGVELSKRGLVCRCGACSQWMPLPTRAHAPCAHCGSLLNGAKDNPVSIVHKTRRPHSLPFIVGETVARYSLAKPLWIEEGYDGLNYKTPNIYASPKLLVRKTGVGLSAAIDYSRAYTNQVVYIFRPQPPCESIPLEFFLGILNSRAMYYCLTKKHGETEWRSHPYLTQTQIMALPLPFADHLAEHSHVAAEMAGLIAPYARAGVELPLDVDAKVERLVASLFGLTRRHYAAIYSMLDTVQDLLPVRKLKRVTVSDIFGK